MTTKKVLLQEIEQTPDALLQEVLDFLLFIRSKYSNGATSSSADLSQSVDGPGLNPLRRTQQRHFI